MDSLQENPSKDYDVVIFTTCDVHGVQRGKFVFGQEINHIMKRGMGLPQAAIVIGILADIPCNLEVYKKDGWKNGVCLPDPSSVTTLAWLAPYKVGHLLCDMHTVEGLPDTTCPRLVLKQQMDKLTPLGVQLVVSQQFEFNVCSKGSRLPLQQDEDIQIVITKLRNFLPKSGIPVTDVTHGSKHWIIRISLASMDAMFAADTVHRLRYVTRSICAHEGHKTTFMTNPFSHDASTQYCLSYWLQTLNGRNAFINSNGLSFHPKETVPVSTIAHQWLAGQLHHSDSTCALHRPTVNCYENPIPHLRVAIKASSTGSPYIEDTRASSASNPYLVLAAIIAAGLNGIQKNMEITQSTGDYPTSLKTAIHKLQQNKDMNNFLGHTFVDCFSQLKFDYEIERFKNAETMTDSERERHSHYLYFDSL